MICDHTLFKHVVFYILHLVELISVMFYHISYTLEYFVLFTDGNAFEVPSLGVEHELPYSGVACHWGLDIAFQ